MTVLDSAAEQRLRESFALQGAMATLGAQLTHVEHGRAHICFDWAPGLSQQHGFIHAGVTLLDHPIDRHTFARAHQKHVARHQRIDRHIDPVARTLDARHLRTQPNQGFNGRRGTCLGPCFQQFPEQDEGDHCRRPLEIDMLVVQVEHRHHGGENPRHAGSQGHQDIHVRPTASQ